MLSSLHNANSNASGKVCRFANAVAAGPWQPANMGKHTNYLRKWREHAGMNQEELAHRAGTDKSVISLLENGHRRLSDKWLRLLAPILGTQPGHLLDTDPDNLDNDIFDIWTKLTDDDREQAVKILRTFLKTGTDE